MATATDQRSFCTRVAEPSTWDDDADEAAELVAATAFASAHEHRRLVQKNVVVDLLDEEIRHVGARDKPACPIARIGHAR